jgi:predicted nucleotidyltransferase
MSQISPPIRILLVCAVAFMAAWMLFLRPKDDAGTPAAATPTAPSTRPVDAGGEQSSSFAGKAVEKANQAKAAEDARSEQLAGAVGETAAAPSATAATPSGPAGEPAIAAEPGKLTKEAAAAGGLPLRVLRALGDRKVVVLLFWSPKAAEDKAVRKALSGIDRHKGKVLAHATNVKRIAAYGQITRGADVEQSPTVVVVDRNRKVETLVGYVDRVTIEQAVTDALRNS